MTAEIQGFNVVFEYTEKAGHYAGGRYWTSYPSEEEFNKKFLPKISKASRARVYAAGVTDEEAIKLCGDSNFIVAIRVAVGESLLPGQSAEGKPKLSIKLLEMRLASQGVQATLKGWMFLRREYTLVE